MNTFILSLRKYLADNRRRFTFNLIGLVALAVMGGACASMLGIGGRDGQVIIVTMMLAVYACVATSLMFSSMKSARGRIATLMEPSSAGVKFMVRWTVAVPVLALLLFGAFWLLEAVRVISWPLFNVNTARWLSPSAIAECISVRSIIGLLLILLAYQAFFLFGGIAWPRLSAIKSLIATWVISNLTIVAVFIAERFYPPFANGNITIDSDSIYAFIVAMCVIVTLFFWWLAYMRLKESEIVDRLI